MQLRSPEQVAQLENHAKFCLRRLLSFLHVLYEHHINTMTSFERPPVTLLPASAEQPIRTIPELIDYNATHNPDLLFCVQAVKDAVPVQITFGQLRDAISRRCARLRVELQLIPGPKKSAPVALVMDSDFELLVHLFALMGMGVPVREISMACGKMKENWIMESGR